ncbi:hypothetical protein KKH39_04600 [Patescibacteria group bacterium]|nr:hypothetical protein [Patescibacteria group bacterium]
MYSQQELLTASKNAVLAGMKVVRQFQLRGAPPAEVKDTDQTLVTQADRQSGEAIREVLREFLPELAIHGEDMDGFSSQSSLLILPDPLDGTRAFTNGLTTSTVIVGIYDRYIKQLVSCVIGEPISGRVWTASSGQLTQVHLFDEPCSREATFWRYATVWDGPLNMQSTILWDLSHGFVSRGKQILTDQQIALLFRHLNQTAPILMPGSNGLHQALVANGGQKLGGSITTAIGGPWDVCGALLVLQAGGAAQGLSMGHDRQLTKVDPLDVLSYDILVTGNSQQTVKTLTEAILAINGQ